MLLSAVEIERETLKSLKEKVKEKRKRENVK